MAFNFSRYSRRVVIQTSTQEYAKQLSERKVPYIDHWDTARFTYPTAKELGTLRIDYEYWGVGSRFYKIAAEHYGDASLWWIIPWFNQVPLESLYSAGNPVMVPKPLERVLNFFM